MKFSLKQFAHKVFGRAKGEETKDAKPAEVKKIVKKVSALEYRQSFAIRRKRKMQRNARKVTRGNRNAKSRFQKLTK